jgi:predicted transcriptional regulator
MGDTNEEMEARLAAARARRTEIAAARAKRDEALELSERLAAEERGVKDDEALEAAERKHGAIGKGIVVLRTDLGCVIVKRPPGPLYKRFAEITDKITVVDCEKLVRPSIVYPGDVEREVVDMGAVDRIFDTYHAAPIQLAGMVRDLVTGKIVEAEGK